MSSDDVAKDGTEGKDEGDNSKSLSPKDLIRTTLRKELEKHEALPCRVGVDRYAHSPPLSTSLDSRL